jgi:hypothetical protein
MVDGCSSHQNNLNLSCRSFQKNRDKSRKIITSTPNVAIVLQEQQQAIA